MVQPSILYKLDLRLLRLHLCVVHSGSSDVVSRSEAFKYCWYFICLEYKLEHMCVCLGMFSDSQPDCGCDHNAECLGVISPNQYSCGCLSGFTGDGRVCVDVDECVVGLHDCVENMNCSDNSSKSINSSAAWCNSTHMHELCCEILITCDTCPKTRDIITTDKHTDHIWTYMLWLTLLNKDSMIVHLPKRKTMTYPLSCLMVVTRNPRQWGGLS